jgi:chemotaxis response regulator CheB
MTGMDRDGVEGLVAVKQHGGVTLVQDPREAPFAELPRNALARVEVDEAASLSSIASRLIDLVGLIEQHHAS